MRTSIALSPLVLIAFAAFAFAACDGGDGSSSGRSGSGSGGSGSSSSSTSSSSSGEGGSSDAITGTVIDVYHPSTGDVSVPNPSEYTSIEAIVDENGTPKSYPGTVDAQGNITIPGVPVGPYWLALTSPPPKNLPGAQPAKSYFATESRTIDLKREFSGRPDVVSMTNSTLLTLTATLGVPWQAFATDSNGDIIQPYDDQLQLISRNASVTGIATGYTLPSVNVPANGDVQLTDWNIDAQDAFSYLGNLNLLDQSKSDDFMITHDVVSHVGAANTSGDPWSDYTYTSVREFFEPAPFSMTDGSTSPLMGAFSPAPMKTFDMNFKGSAFSALIANIPKTFVYTDISIYLEAGTPQPQIGAFSLLFDVNVSPGTKYTNPDPTCQGAGCDMVACPSGCDVGTEVPVGDHTHAYAYGNPFKFGQELADVYIYFQQSVTQLLPEKTSERLRGWFLIQAPVGEVTGKPIQPVIGFPENIQVAGKATPYDQITTGVGLTPTLTWTAPSLGKPSHYSVAVIDLTDATDAQGNVVRRRTVATMALTGTSVTIPAGILQTGRNYSFEVRAKTQDNDDLSKPFNFSQHEAEAMMFTGVVTP